MNPAHNHQMKQSPGEEKRLGIFQKQNEASAAGIE